MFNRFIILAVLIPLTLAQTSPSPSGQTLDLCTDSSDCTDPRKCIESTIPEQCSLTLTSPSCLRCIPPEGLHACTVADDCPYNESCFANPNLPSLICMSHTEGPLIGAKIVGDSDQSRVTLDVCSIDQDCAGERVCRFLSPGITESCENRTSCKCLTAIPVTCETSDTCDPGEVCILTSGLGNICVSEIVADDAGVPPAEESGDNLPGPDTPTLPPPNQATSPPSTDTPIVKPPNVTASLPPTSDSNPGGSKESSDDSLDNPIPTVRPGSPPSSNGTNLVLENCISDADCLPPRKCLVFSYATTAGNPLCGTSASCVCGFKPIPPCTSDEECTEGEVCSLAGGTTFETCVSQAVIDAFIEEDRPLFGALDTPEPSPENSAEPVEEEGVCMDARLLSHLSQKELVFSSHRRARVLCDEFESCATAGHMVKHHGRAMMMRRYCAKVGCVGRFMMVNSPRRRRGMVVPSRTEGLVLTAFAARYVTNFEEVVLRVMIMANL